jgi:hypothetical protein
MVSCRQRNDSFTPDIEERIGTDHERADPLLRERREGGVDLGIHGGGQYQSSLPDLARCLLYVFQLGIGIRVLRIQQHGDQISLGNAFAQKS